MGQDHVSHCVATTLCKHLGTDPLLDLWEKNAVPFLSDKGL